MHYCNNDIIKERFPNHKFLNPESEDEITTFLASMIEDSVKTGIFPLLLIRGHGTPTCSQIVFPKLRISSDLLSFHLNWTKTQKRCENFRCGILLETCFSGDFDPNCATGIVTSCKSNNLSHSNLLTDSLSEVLRKQKIFEMRDIYNTANNTSTNNSETVIQRTTWCTNKMTEQYANKNN